MGKKLTHEEFENRIHKIQPNIIFTTKYINARTKVHCKCLIDGFEWDATPDNLLHGTGCPICSGTYMDKNILIDRLKTISPEITIIGDYINNMTKILCYCKKHNEYFMSSPTHLLRGQTGCKKCQHEKASESTKYTQKQFEDKFYDCFGSEYIVIGKYISSTTSIKIKCIKCDTEFSIIPNNAFSRGINCPTCHKSRSMPKGEERIFDYLSKNNIIFIHGYEFDDLFGVNDGRLSYDFYLPTENLLIEYNGEQHYRSVKYFGGEEKFKIQQEHDLRKYNYANLHNYNLLIIPYTQYGNIEEILSSTIKIAA